MKLSFRFHIVQQLSAAAGMEPTEDPCAGTLQYGEVEISCFGQLSGNQFSGSDTK